MNSIAERLASSLKIRPGEGRKAALLIGLLLSVSVGGSIGGTGMDALFYSRFRIEPYYYILLGLVTFVNLMAVTSLLNRVSRERLYVVLPFALALVLLGEWALVILKAYWFYPVMWLSKEVLNSLAGLFSWGLAAAVCDTRQAKRLFPLFTAGSIFGTLLGSFGTPLLVNWLHSENLLLVWGMGFFLTFVLCSLLARPRARAQPGASASAAHPARARDAGRRRAAQRASVFHEMQQGYQFVRGSPLMRWVSFTAMLFSVLWFALLLPFTRAATEQYPAADALASFFATFQGAYTILALLASLLVANRLFARFGLVSMLLVYPAIYFSGFAVLLVYASFPALVVFRFVQLIWSQGIADTVWQAVFNVVPAGRRDQTWAFVNGVPGQAGIVIAGLLLIVGEQTLAPQQLYIVGLGAAALTLFTVWRAKRAYGGALTDALRAGQPQVFFSEEEPFGGFQQDAAALAAVVSGVSNPDPAARHVAVEILGHIPAPQAVDALINALADPSAQVRAASLRALARAGVARALLEIAACLKDPEAEVRLSAVSALQGLAASARGLVAHVQPLLADPDPALRARVAVTLLRADGRLTLEETHRAALEALKTMAAAPQVEARANALEALAECGAIREMETFVADGLRDASPAVRRAAVSALAACGLETGRALDLLIGMLGDEDRSVSEAAARAIGAMGAPALDRTTAALADPRLETGALLALERLPASRAALTIRDYAARQVAQALHYFDLSRGVEARADAERNDRLRLLFDSLRARTQYHAVNALRAVGLLGDRGSIALAVENLQSRHPNQRANALETLEAIGDAQVVKPLLRVWETAESAPATAHGTVEDTLRQALNDADNWLRACAALAVSDSADSPVRADCAQLAESDADAVVRETAALALKGRTIMETLATLPLMERILLLRRVPLFAGLPPADLKQVAAITREAFFADGEWIAAQGDPGDEMYVIVSGEVRVLVGEEAPVEIARRQPGDIVGEMAIISQEPRIASLVAAGEVRVLCVERKQFEALLRERPETSLAVMRVLCARLKEKAAR